MLPNLHFVRLRRRDVLGQAMSWVRSRQTGQFRSTESPAHEAHYDGAAIRSYVGQVCQRNARWDMFFAHTGIVPVELVYEEVARDPQAAVNRMAETLGLPCRPWIDAARVQLAIQRDERTREWRERFNPEYGDRSRMDAVDLLAATL